MEGNLHKIASPVVDLAGDRQTIGFTPDVNTAEALCEVLNRYRPGKAEWICGDERRVTREQRRKILADYAQKKLQYVVNCPVLTEGFGSPGTSCIALARPTGSRSLLTQIVGRGTRVLPGLVEQAESPEERCELIASSDKRDLLVIDFWANTSKHKLLGVADVLGGNSILQTDCGLGS